MTDRVAANHRCARRRKREPFEPITEGTPLRQSVPPWTLMGSKEATLPNQTSRDLSRPLAIAALALLLSACSGETINLGENTSRLEAPDLGCPAGAVVARAQADIDALAGCESSMRASRALAR